MRIVQRIITKLQRKKFKSLFKSMGEGSGFGSLGVGDNCIIKGSEGIEIGCNSWFGDGSEIIVQHHKGAKLRIGDGVSSTCRCRITCGGEIVIEDNVLIAPDVFITDHNHGMDPSIPGGYQNQPIVIKNVCINKGVWLGQRCCVLPGVTIGEHSIIGANSVVTKDIPPFTIAVGSPARVVKKWNSEDKEWLSV